MATDTSLLRNETQRRVQETLLQYHVAPTTARAAAQVELRNWTPARLTSIFDKIDDPGRELHRFIPLTTPVGLTEHERDLSFVKPPQAEIERAAREKRALCINSAGGWAVREDGYVAISHVWIEGIRADEDNRGLSRVVLDGIFHEIRMLNVDWVWLDCLAIPGGNRKLTAHQEVVKKDVINSLANVYRNAAAVVIFDSLVMGLQSRDLVDTAVVLLCGRWMTRVWTLQEICLARNAFIVTARGLVYFKSIVRALHYLSEDDEDVSHVLGPHNPQIKQMVSDPRSSDVFESLYLRLIRLMLVQGKGPPSLTQVSLCCYGRSTGNDIDYARAFFPLLGLEWKVEYTREQGMLEIYQSQRDVAKRMILQHGAPRSTFRPGWAPAYLTGLAGPLIQYDDPLGDIQWTRRGILKKWYTYTIVSQEPPPQRDVMLVGAIKTDRSVLRIVCRLNARETELSRLCFIDAIAQKQAFLLTNQELLFPTSNGLAISALLIARDPEVSHAKEAWVCFTIEAACLDGARGTPEVQEWLLLHESPVSEHDTSGKAYTRLARSMDHSSGRIEEGDLLHAMIREGDYNKFCQLLYINTDLESKNDRGLTALHTVVLQDQRPMLDALLRRNVNVNAQDNAGRTPLNLAAEKGNAEFVRALLEHGADPNLYPHDDAGTLNQAIIRKQHEVVQLLVEGGASVTARDGLGWHPLFYACSDFRCASILIDAGADPMLEVQAGAQLIHWAARAGETDTVALLLDRGVDVNVRESVKEDASFSLGPTALYRAVQEKKEDTVKLLLDHGADPNLMCDGRKPMTPFLLAAQFGNHRLLQMFLTHPRGFAHRFNDVARPENKTALHLAAQNGHRIAVKMLLEAGWDYTARDAQGKTPAELAVEAGHKEVADFTQAFESLSLS